MQNLIECEKIGENVFKVGKYSELFMKSDGNYTSIEVEAYKDDVLIDSFILYAQWEKIRKEYLGHAFVSQYGKIDLPFIKYCDYYIIKLTGDLKYVNLFFRL